MKFQRFIFGIIMIPLLWLNTQVLIQSMQLYTSKRDWFALRTAIIRFLSLGILLFLLTWTLSRSSILHPKIKTALVIFCIALYFLDAVL